MLHSMSRVKKLNYWVSHLDTKKNQITEEEHSVERNATVDEVSSTTNDPADDLMRIS